MSKAAIIHKVCCALSQGEHEQAATIASTDYPFAALAKAERRHTETEMMRVFIRDGFIDRVPVPPSTSCPDARGPRSTPACVVVVARRNGPS